MGTADSKKGPVVLGSACRVPGEGICSSARDGKIIDWGTCRAGPCAPPEADAGQTGQFLGAWWPLVSLFLPVVLSFCDDWPRPTWLLPGGAWAGSLPTWGWNQQPRDLPEPLAAPDISEFAQNTAQGRETALG